MISKGVFTFMKCTRDRSHRSLFPSKQLFVGQIEYDPNLWGELFFLAWNSESYGFLLICISPSKICDISKCDCTLKHLMFCNVSENCFCCNQNIILFVWAIHPEYATGEYYFPITITLKMNILYIGRYRYGYNYGIICVVLWMPEYACSGPVLHDMTQLSIESYQMFSPHCSV